VSTECSGRRSGRGPNSRALVPPSEERQYQGSGPLATGAGFLTILVLAEVV
jgi:hypothetical protein